MRGEKTQAISMGVVKITDVIVGKIGKISEKKYINEIVTHVAFVINIVKEERFKHTISRNIGKHMTTQWKIWLRFVRNVIQKLNQTQNSLLDI